MVVFMPGFMQESHADETWPLLLRKGLCWQVIGFT